MSDEFKKGPKWKRQHTVSMPAAMYTVLQAEAYERGHTIGEFCRAIFRCWLDQRPMPPRHIVVSQVGEQQAAPLAPPQPPARAVAPRPPPDLPAVRADGRPALASVPDPVLEQPQRLPDPDFDSPDSLKEAEALLARVRTPAGSPF